MKTEMLELVRANATLLAMAVNTVRDDVNSDSFAYDTVHDMTEYVKKVAEVLQKSLNILECMSDEGIE